MATLRPYQEHAVLWLLERHGRGLLDMDPGTGKTAVSLTAIRALAEPRVLVAAPKVALGVWLREAETWAPGWPILRYTGTPAKRKALWAQYLAQGGILLTNFAMLEEIRRLAPTWPVIVYDESHYLRNRNTALFTTVKALKAAHVMLLTGSSICNGPSDLWSQLRTVHPKNFSSFWRWANEYLEVTKDYWGTTVGGIVDPAKFQDMARPYVLTVRKQDVLPDLPAKTRQIIPFTMTEQQATAYADLEAKMIAEMVNEQGERRTVLTPTVLAQITRLRQLTITPALIGGAHESGAFDTLAELVACDLDAGLSCLVFTPFTQAIPYIQAVLDPVCDHVGVVQGGMAPAAIDAVVATFQEHPSTKKAIIASVNMGTSWTATAASSVFFLGSAWNPAVNVQAEDRCHRISQTRPVLVRYLVAEGTIDENILDVVEQKATWAELARDPQALLRPRQAKLTADKKTA